MAERLFKVIILLCILIVWPFQIGTAEEPGNAKKLWRELNHTSDTILRYVKEGHYEESHQLLNQFSDQFLSIRASEYGLTMKEIQVITSVFEEALEATIAVSLSHEERINKVYKLRLLVDVYDTSYEPLWKKTQNSLINPVQNMVESIEQENTSKFQADFNEFIKSYEMVQPGWSVSLPYEVYQRIDSQIQYLHHLRADLQKKSTIINHLELINNELHLIYEGQQEEVSDPSLIWVMITTGGAIFLSLTYAGWKKYRAEKEKQKKVERVRRRTR